MSECKNIEAVMDGLAGIGPDAPDQTTDPLTRRTTAGLLEQAETHLSACPFCRSRFSMQLEIFKAAAQWEPEAEAVMATIDWEQNAADITAGIAFRPSAASRRFVAPSPRGFRWVLALPTIAAVFLLGIGLGYFLFTPSATEPLPAPPSHDGPDFSMARLETTLTKKEMNGYFKQTQLLLTDLMRQCSDNDEAAAGFNSLNMKRVKRLLEKNRYLSKDTSNPQLLSTRRLLKKIEWLLYEMAVTGGNMNCQQLKELQDYVQRERLLLKLRLVSKDISTRDI